MCHGGIEVLVREIIRGTGDSYATFLVSADDLPDAVRASFPSIRDLFIWSLQADPADESLRLVDWLKKHRVDIAHFHFGTYGWYARSWSNCPIPHVSNSGIPCVSTNHGAFTLFDCVAPYRPLWFKLLSLPLFWPAKLRQIFHVRWEATVSLNDLSSVRKWFFPARAKFFQLYHSKIHENEKHEISEKKLVILCLGTVGERKGQQYLLEAFAQIAGSHPGWELILAGRHGHGTTMARIEQLLQQNPAIRHRVKILPGVSDETALDLLKTSAIFAMPSTAEGLGLSLQEAQFYGCACIGSRVGGIPELIEDEVTGILVPPADSQALAAGLIRLIDNPELRTRFSEMGRQSIVARGMTAERMVGKYLKLYEDTIQIGSDKSMIS